MSTTRSSTPSNTASSVLDLTRSCISKFELLSTLEDPKHNEALENRMADLKLWADGVGAIAKGGASLDSRFNNRPDDLDLVKSILIMLGSFLDEYAELAEKDSPTSEATCNVDSAMKNLAMIGVAIRRTGKASRSRRADRMFDPTKHMDFRRHLECIVLLRPSEDGRRPDDLDVSQLDEIQNRLIEANLRRRHRFLLAQIRSSNSMGSRMQQQNPGVPADEDCVSESGPRTDEDSKTNLLPSRPSLRHKEKAPPTMTGFSTASTAEGSLQYKSAKTEKPEPAKTQITLISSSTEFPEPPQLSSGRLICKCPCCCQSIPFEELSSPGKWRQHLIDDLCPYTCVAENCPTPHMLFCTRKEWESHVKKDHPTQWQCPLCDEEDLLFSSMEGIVDHIQGSHKDQLSDNPISALVSWSVVQCMGIKSCPLCSSYGPQDSPELVDHVLRHAYEFSLRALPWPRPVIHDLDKPVGAYNLPEKKEDAERLEQWIREADSGASELLEISKFDTNSHSAPASMVPTDYTDYFAESEYFREESGEGTSKRLGVQSKSPFDVSQSLDDDIAPPSNTTGMNVLYEGAKNADVDVVAVHGLSGDSYSTWASGETVWLRDLLPLLPEFEQARIMTFEYDARLFIQPFEMSQVGGTLKVAKDLLNDLADRRIVAKKRPLIFVGHSLGGFVIKSALNYAHTHIGVYGDILNSTKSVVFFGTPHKDFDLVGWTGTLGPVANRVGLRTAEAVKELQRWSHPLNKLSISFEELSSKFSTITFFESQKTGGVMVVPEADARMTQSVGNVYRLEGDHLSICKFAVEDQNWISVLARMRAIKRTIAEELEVSDQMMIPVGRRDHSYGDPGYPSGGWPRDAC